MTLVASAKAPARCSSLSSLTRCPGFWTLAQVDDGEHGSAANTGSAVGRGVELWHAGYTLGDAVARVQAEASEKFPFADMDATTRMIRNYTRDERNGQTAAGHCELEVRLVLEPDPSDPTGEPIHLVGHVDQIRRGPDGRLRVWDLKCGRPSGLELLYSYAWQLAAYSLAASATLGETVYPGGIIRGRAYDYVEGGKSKGAQDPSVVHAFYEAPWSPDECRVLLGSVRYHVARLREGLVLLHPGPHCQWCPGVNPAACQSRF